MPYKRRHRGNRKYGRGKRRNLAKTLRNRTRKKVGLNTRVTLANRQQIRRINKNIETKMCDQIQALAANEFDGQFNDNVRFDPQGQESIANIPFSPSLLRLAQGSASHQRNSDWVTMKSLTVKYCITADNRAGPYQRLYMMLVLDQMGEVGSGTSVNEVLQLTSAAPAPANAFGLAYQNLNNTGKNGRFKILWKKHHTVSMPLQTTHTVPAANAPVPATPPPVAQASYQAAGVSEKVFPRRVYGSVTIKRPYKLNYGQETTEKSPDNQTIRLYCWSESVDSPTVGNDAQLQYYCRFRFKDA